MGTDGARRLGRYELLQELGSGGMATVHVARGVGPRGFERLFAVKCCHPHLRKEADFATMFLDEARLAAAIHHPNVVPVVDMGEEDDTVFLVMEYVDGERLSRLMKVARTIGRPIPVPIIIRLFRDVLSGLHAAHEATSIDGTPLCIVHRDVTPENVLVGADGSARLIDFGIAKAAVRETATTCGVVKGKLAYLAPEQLGRSRIDRRVDLWAAGVSLWEALANERLFGGAESHAEIVAAVLGGAIPLPSSRNPEVPRALDAIVLRALRREPTARFGSALEMSAALEDLSLPAATPREVSAVVQRLVGDVLDERRASLSRALDAAHVVTAASAETTDTTAPFSVPRRRRPLWAVLALAVAAMGVASFLRSSTAPGAELPPIGMVTEGIATSPRTLPADEQDPRNASGTEGRIAIGTIAIGTIADPTSPTIAASEIESANANVNVNTNTNTNANTNANANANANTNANANASSTNASNTSAQPNTTNATNRIDEAPRRRTMPRRPPSSREPPPTRRPAEVAFDEL